MDELRKQFQAEKARKQKLDEELQKVKNELDTIEISFPKEVNDLKEQIEQAKNRSNEYEKKTQELKKELDQIRAQKK